MEGTCNQTRQQKDNQQQDAGAYGQRQKWRDILEVILIVDGILYLSKQSLPFKEHDENKTSKNQGNFLEFLKMISKYHPVLMQGIQDHEFTKRCYILFTIHSKRINRNFGI